jgi:hypothetical protein
MSSLSPWTRSWCCITDGITEHQRDPIQGEAELVAAAKIVHGLPQINAARAIARRVFRKKRGDDDAAALGLRTLPREPHDVIAALGRPRSLQPRPTNDERGREPSISSTDHVPEGRDRRTKPLRTYSSFLREW